MDRADKPYAGLRVGVKNGGCAGSGIHLRVRRREGPLDEVVEDQGVTILIDPKAVLFLIGTDDRLRDHQAVVEVRVQQPERDRRLRLRRERDHSARSGGSGLMLARTPSCVECGLAWGAPRFRYEDEAPLYWSDTGLLCSAPCAQTHFDKRRADEDVRACAGRVSGRILEAQVTGAVPADTAIAPKATASATRPGPSRWRGTASAPSRR